MKPENLQTKIFLDSGDPEHTKIILESLGYLDGQTTNPSLVAKSPKIALRIEQGDLLSSDELLGEYKNIVTQIAQLIPGKSISIEVYADKNTTAQEIIEQAHEMNTWINYAHIKIPTIPEGLKAAEQLAKENMKLNFTLIFNQEQAAAINSVVPQVQKGDIFVSPFEGRLHDKGIDGIDLIRNISRMYAENNSAIEVLAASIRDVKHLLYLIYMNVDIVTVPFDVLKEWADLGAPMPGDTIPLQDFENDNIFFKDEHAGVTHDLAYENFDLSQHWQKFNIQHDMTDQGLAKFANDWNKLLK